ncbi:MAG: hypothetical protein LC746_10950 [Acidobacteria bacterium]|nr:hypothetical protein [Acidobacteriota bacterium]
MKVSLIEIRLLSHPSSLVLHSSSPVALPPPTFLVVAFVAATLALVVFAASARHKKSSSAPLDLVGRVGVVVRDLTPEGAVLVRGELFPARAPAGERIERAGGVRVRVVGARGHLLEVEREE